MNATIRSAYSFFRKHAGYIVGENAKGALQLAKAEVWAEANGYRYAWRHDDDVDLGDHEYWCNDAKRFKAGYDSDGDRIPSYSRRGSDCDHEVLSCLMYAPCEDEDRHSDCSDYEPCRDCEVVASLGGVIDASNDYRRVVEAELALEAMPDHPGLEADIKALIRSR